MSFSADYSWMSTTGATFPLPPTPSATSLNWPSATEMQHQLDRRAQESAMDEHRRKMEYEQNKRLEAELKYNELQAANARAGLLAPYEHTEIHDGGCTGNWGINGYDRLGVFSGEKSTVPKKTFSGTVRELEREIDSWHGGVLDEC